MIGVLLAALALAQPAPTPTDQTLVYYNARMALRDGDAMEAARHWLLRNAVRDATGQVSVHDPDFHSLTWAALGQLGLCMDGHPVDEDGAGLWPLALHNYVVKNRGRRGKPGKPLPFEAFQLDRQQRFITISDVLSAEELRTVTFFRSPCLRQRIALIASGELITADFADRQVAGRVLLYLLDVAEQTLSDNVRGRAALAARRFDVHLHLTELAEREARQLARERAREGRLIGLSRASTTAMVEDADSIALDPESEAARILEECVYWPVSEWIALSPERRMFLFDKARAWGGDPAELDRIALGILDHLIAEGEGEQVGLWIGLRSEDPSDQQAVWEGTRGAALLTLDRETGFRERGVVSLHRGVGQLQRGQLEESLRSMAWALNASVESVESEALRSLSLRWLTYIAAQFEITDELLVTVQELIPRSDFNVLLEDLMWSAALRADDRSFRRGVAHHRGRGALERRLNLLEPLSKGNLTVFSNRMKRGLDDSPAEHLRFLDQLVQRLEREDAGVRAAQLPTLKRMRVLLQPLADSTEGSSRQIRTANSLIDRMLAISEGIEGLGEGASASDKARVNDPTAEVYAGAVRLAPADPLPWPFGAPEVSAPSIFTTFDLVPVEWRGADGEWVYGWQIEG